MRHSTSDQLRRSAQWRRDYEHNARALLAIPWQLGAELTPAERAAIAASAREFQAGESSSGNRLYSRARRHARRTGDRDYAATMRLFIAEEQRHGRDLGRFMTLNGIELVDTTPTDRVFRRLRHLCGGLETSITVLLAAEIIAEVYYVGLRAATGSVVLRRLCDQILLDEQRHVQFQAERLALLRARRRLLGGSVGASGQRMLYLGAAVVVWRHHCRALRRGGFTWRRWWHSCWREYRRAFGGSRSATITGRSSARRAA